MKEMIRNTGVLLLDTFQAFCIALVLLTTGFIFGRGTNYSVQDGGASLFILVSLVMMFPYLISRLLGDFIWRK